VICLFTISKDIKGEIRVVVVTETVVVVPGMVVVVVHGMVVVVTETVVVVPGMVVVVVSVDITFILMHSGVVDLPWRTLSLTNPQYS